jgi:hypothetical protein
MLAMSTILEEHFILNHFNFFYIFSAYMYLRKVGEKKDMFSIFVIKRLPLILYRLAKEKNCRKETNFIVYKRI